MGIVFGLGLDMSCGLESSKYKKEFMDSIHQIYRAYLALTTNGQGKQYLSMRRFAFASLKILLFSIKQNMA